MISFHKQKVKKIKLKRNVIIDIILLTFLLVLSLVLGNYIYSDVIFIAYYFKQLFFL